MSNIIKYYPVNWTEGMKLNKDIFIAQDNAAADNASCLAAATLGSIKYGLLPGYNFDVQISIDNQNTARISVMSCTAITIGGNLIDIKALDDGHASGGNPSVNISMPTASGDTIHWVILLGEPFERIPFGAINPNESPARLPYVKPAYNVLLIEDRQLQQYSQHPHALIIGKINTAGTIAVVDKNYLPPCISVSASQDLMGLHAELDSFLSNLEQHCAAIVQKIYKKSQHNELSELAQFLCDRVMLYLGQAITDFRWLNLHDIPAVMLSRIIALARTIKNIIDLRIGSGREELMNYLCEWCDLKQGELEAMLSNMALLRYNHNDINENINTIVVFVKTISKLFSTLSSLDFIGKRKESGLFVKEEITLPNRSNTDQPKPKRKFFG